MGNTVVRDDKEIETSSYFAPRNPPPELRSPHKRDINTAILKNLPQDVTVETILQVLTVNVDARFRALDIEIINKGWKKAEAMIFPGPSPAVIQSIKEILDADANKRSLQAFMNRWTFVELVARESSRIIYQQDEELDDNEQGENEEENEEESNDVTEEVDGAAGPVVQAQIVTKPKKNNPGAEVLGGDINEIINQKGDIPDKVKEGAKKHTEKTAPPKVTSVLEKEKNEKPKEGGDPKEQGN